MSLRISELPAAGTLDGVELVEVSRLSNTITRTATTISADSTTNSFHDSAGGFLTAGFAVGQSIKSSGFTGSAANNKTARVITEVDATDMVFGGADGDDIVTDAAGESVTLTAWVSKAATPAATIRDATGYAPDAAIVSLPKDYARLILLHETDPPEMNMLTTISWVGATQTVHDSANGFLTAGFAVGDLIELIAAGDSDNDIEFAKVISVSAGTMQLAECVDYSGLPTAIVDEAAGDQTTISKWNFRKVRVADLMREVSLGDLAETLGATDGDMLYYNNADWVRLAKGSMGQVLGLVSASLGGTEDPQWVTPSSLESWGYACSDETTALTTGVKITDRAAYNFRVSSIKASLTTAQTSGSILTIDIKVGGVSIFSTLLTIDNTEKTSATAATAYALTSSPTTIGADAEFTIEITQIGDGTAKGLKVRIIGEYSV